MGGGLRLAVLVFGSLALAGCGPRRANFGASATVVDVRPSMIVYGKTTLAAGETTTVDLDLTNAGGQDSGALPVIVQTVDSATNPSLQVGSTVVPNVPGNQTVHAQFTVTAPTTPGSYLFYVTVDPNHTVQTEVHSQNTTITVQ